MGAVYRKEMRSYLTSMIGYVFIAFILTAVSIYFAYLNLNLASPRFEQVLQSIQFIFVIFVPILTMRVLAEEKKQRTDQLLLTLPLTIPEIVIGKFLAVLTLFTVPMVIICGYPMILAAYGTVNLPVAYMSILSFYLLGAADIAIGVFISSLTENPIISAVISFGVLLMCYLMNGLCDMVPRTATASFVCFGVLILILAAIYYRQSGNFAVTAGLGIGCIAVLCAAFTMKRTLFEGLFQKFLQIFYMTGKLQNFFDGILDICGIIYFLSIMSVALFMTVQTLTKRRWE